MLCSKLSKDVIIFNCKKDNLILFDDKIYFQWQWPTKEDWNIDIISLEIHHGITKSWRTYSWETYVFCTVANISKKKDLVLQPIAFAVITTIVTMTMHLQSQQLSPWQWIPDQHSVSSYVISQNKIQGSI